MVLSVDFTGRSLHVVQASVRNGAVAADRCASARLPASCAKNGMVLDEDVFVSELARLLGGFSAREMIVCAGTPLASARSMTVPNVPASRLRGVVRGELANLAGEQGGLPGDTVFDYLVDDPGDSRGAMIGVTAVTLPASVVNSWRSIAARLDRKASALDVQANALTKLVALDKTLRGCPACIVASSGDGAFNLDLFENGRHLINRNVAAEDAAPAQSEFILSSFTRPGVQEQDAVYTAAFGGLSKLVQFQASRNRANPIRQVWMCGDASADAPLLARLSDTLELPVAPLPGPDAVRLPAGESCAVYAGAIGAAIRRRG